MKSHGCHLPKSDLEIVYNIKYFFCEFVQKSKSLLFVYALFLVLFKSISCTFILCHNVFDIYLHIL